ncbi:MAG: glycoside hydrolase family 2 TIM barrel-domain containing protein [Clostridia bacterium]
MLYTFKNDNYNNFPKFQENKLAPRAYFIPFITMDECNNVSYLEERYNSRLVTCLAGKWDFAFFGRISDMPLQIDTFDYNFEQTVVPSCWQFQGYDKPFYVNSRYMFDCYPPNVPADEGTIGRNVHLDIDAKEVKIFNKCALYRKTFRLVRQKKHILTFLGVSSALQLYVNGHYIGYSEGSHNTAEFDITSYVIDGPNEIVALVYQWCNGTYLECQDMFRNNGIFRDVYVSSFDDNYIYDYAYTTKVVEGNNWVIDIATKFHAEAGTELLYSLYDGKELVATASGANALVGVKNPRLWSAEIPNLYTLYIYLKKNNKIVQCVRQEIGFKEIRIEGNVFLLNNVPLKLKGVNHHDSTATNGYTMTWQELVRDAELMKELNVNCVRTSHYPPDPTFLKIANHYGLYIVDEADIETHGVYGQKINRPNQISNNRKWQGHYWDRVERMFERDKNNVCVVMWSLGNESGGWKNQDYCYAKLKALTNIPIHYEGVCRTPRWAYDVVSAMYTSTEQLEKYCDNKLPSKFYNKPFFLCEYAHAMGVGPGSLNLYVELFDKLPSMLGGCVWEWCDHAVLHADGSYTYGGEHGEYVHDKNFCVDGLVYPDREPSTSAYLMQAAYRPIKASYMSNNKYILANNYQFADSSNIDIAWEYITNGELVSNGKVEEIIRPRTEISIFIKHPALDTAKDCFINFIYTDKTTGKLIAKEQITLCKFIPKLLPIQQKADVVCFEENGLFKIMVDGGEIIFDHSTGQLVTYKLNGAQFMLGGANAKGFMPGVYRPAIDNYMYIDKTWRAQGLADNSFKLKKFDSRKIVGGVEVTTEFVLTVKEKEKMLAINSFTVYGNGIIDVSATLRMAKGFDLPRYGLELELPPECRFVQYYGNGEKENYSDMSEHTTIGIFETETSDMYDHYIRPQDSGNRANTRWAKVVDSYGVGLAFVASQNAFNFSALPFDDEAVEKAKHRIELKEMNKTVVKINGFVRGIGSSSCGPDTREEYRYTSGSPINYVFRVLPVFPAKEKPKADTNK